MEVLKGITKIIKNATGMGDTMPEVLNNAYVPGDKLRARNTVRCYHIAKGIVYTVREWNGYEIYLKETGMKLYGLYFERASDADVINSEKILRKFIKDHKIPKTQNPYLKYSEYIYQKERDDFNADLHKELKA